MVMITRSAYRKACESSNSSDISQNNIIPPWCSSGKVSERRARKLPTWEIRSSYPVRENIWEYLHADAQRVISKRKRSHCNCKEKTKRTNGKNVAILFAFLIIAVALMASIWITNIPKINLLTKVIQGDKLVSLLGVARQTEISEECCYRMKYLVEELFKTQQALRHTLRVRRTMMISTQITRAVNAEVDRKYIEGASVTKGSDTKEWGGQVALWGVVPLWRAAPPPDIVLARRKPTPSDCWPFSGSHGEILIELPQYIHVNYISVEHIRPDAARSAPKDFTLYGVLENGTLVNTVEGEYQNKGAAKQYFRCNWSKPLKHLIFRVLSNQGNSKYTCVYRIHLYSK
ncbi:hypothetical protein ABMA28_014889 [Loxostege sticticalis]|uniref:SUN domain-containing protein n=1 Tax=Loxostege sticticalis TaxID=481309 RepID=A0ABD0TDC8_LOXSC